GPLRCAGAGEGGGPHEVAFRDGRARLEEPRPVLAAEGDLRALAAPDVEVGEDLLVLALEGERAHAGLRVERVAEVDLPRELLDACEELVLDAPLHEEPRARDAGLPRAAGEDGAGGPARGGVEVRVGEDDVRGLPAELA